MAVTLDPALLSSALLVSMVAVAGSVWPAWFIDFIGVGFFLNGIYLAWALRPAAAS